MKSPTLCRSLSPKAWVLLCVIITITSGELLSTPRDCRNIIKTFTDDQGNFSSPGGSSGYPNNSVCSWDFRVSVSAKVQIIFWGFDLEASKTCTPYDSVSVQENCNSTWVNIGERQAYCGNRSRFNVTSRCGLVRVKFRSDYSVTGRGFNASYRVIRDRKPPIITCLGRGCNTTQHQIAEDTFRLDCKAEGYPVPTVEWSREGGPMPRTKPLFNGSIILLNVKRSDTGIYICMANNSMGGVVGKLKLLVAEKCTCPQKVLTNYYELPPYTKTGRYKDKSLFRLILKDLFQSCCGNCSGGHGPSEILFDAPGSMKTSLVEVKKYIDVKNTISFPIPGNKDDMEYQELRFVPIVSSPGVAFIVVNEEPGTSAQAVFQSVLGGWPVLVLTLVMALLSGMIMWALDTWNNPDEFPRSFMKGSGEGFWWAFVTMTTVGYGDRSPRGFFARIFAIIWVLVGLVITSIFTGVVTTSLTAITLSTDTKLYGTNVTAIKNSTEYRLGLNKNARMTGEETLDLVASKLSKRIYKGALVDSYVASEVDAFSDNPALRVSKIIDYSSHYGIVFGDRESGKLSADKFQQCLVDYVLTFKAQISKTVEANTKAMKKPKESAAVEKSSGLFDSNSSLFKNSVYICLGMLLFLAACGLIWDYGYMRHWRKRSELEELEMLGGPGYEVSKRNMEMMDSMMLEVQEFYEHWNRRLDDLTSRHDDEQKIVSKHHK